MKRAPVQISKLCEITSSKRIFAKDYLDQGVPFFRGKEVTEKYKGALSVSTELFISEEKYQEIKQKHGVPITGDMLLTSVGTLGSTYIVRPSDRFYFKDGNLTWFRKFNGLNSTYLKYWLESPEGMGELKRSVIGSSQSAYTIANLKQMTISLPSEDEQQAIVERLQSYDNLIDNNKRRIAILEEMAQSLYREWFVKFRFPGHDQCQMVESPLGLIPEGWEVTTIEDIAEVKGGKRLPKGKAVLDAETPYRYLRVKDFTDKGIDLSDIKFIDTESHIATEKYVISSEDVYISIAGTIGRVGLVPKKLTGAHLTENAAKICRFEAQEYQLYTCLMLQSEIIQKSIQSKVSGAAQPKLALYKIKEIPFLAPDNETLKCFENAVRPCFALIENLNNKNQNLKKQRDFLLPKLISGQIDLSQTEQSSA